MLRIVDTAIIPRLLLAHRTSRPQKRPARDQDLVGPSEIAALVALAIHQPLSAVRRFVDTLRARGVSAEAVVGDVLPAVARHVGRLWETDACSFVDVTIVVSGLQQLLHDQARDMSARSFARPNGRRVLLSTMPGEQHTFGISVAEAFLRKAAWDVVPLAPKTMQTVLRCVSERAFDFVGLSASDDRHLAAMPGLAAAIRRRSVNRDVRIVAAGLAVVRGSKHTAKIGADIVILDLHSGMRQMEDLVRSAIVPLIQVA